MSRARYPKIYEQRILRPRHVVIGLAFTYNTTLRLKLGKATAGLSMPHSHPCFPQKTVALPARGLVYNLYRSPIEDA